jgi:hypothetical protein
MQLADLNADERIALVGLLKVAILSNGRVSEDEVAEVKQIIAEIGEEAYQRALDEFEARFPDEPSFMKFLTSIARQEARDLIYGTIFEGATADAMDSHESELLSWLAEEWKIEVSIADQD